MQPKFILSPALAARLGLSDVDLASLFDMELLRVVPATERNTCPKCGNHVADSYAQLLVSKPAEAPEQVSGRHIVWCFCESVYSYAFVHTMDAEQAPGQARVGAASASAATAPKVDEPPPMRWGRHPAYDLAHARRADWDYEYYQGYSAPSAAEIWAANEAAKREADGPSAAS